ncbi:MAG: hypothetical protein ACLTHR_12270 [Agathobacter rectalis]|jgi:hypothetical protein
MAISEEIKKRIYSVLGDGKVHYTEEIRKKCVDDGILKEDEVGKIRGVVYYLKKRDSRIKSEGRGKYRLVDGVQDNTMTNDDLQNAIETIENCMDEWRSINWLRCSEDQLNKIRDDFKDLKFLAKEINNFEKREKW